MIPGIEWGTGIILWLQQLGSWLETPMKAVSFLSTEYAYLFLLPALFWCIDAGMALRVGISVMTVNSLNSGFKLLLHTPRPFWINPDVKALAVETSFGAPSGHSINAVGLWGRLAAAIRTRWLKAFLILLIALIAISRLYLGVHYPIDVLLGLLAGTILVWLLVRLEKPVLRWFLSLEIWGQIASLLFAAIILIGFGYGASQIAKGTPVPELWLARVQEVDPGNPGHPYNLDGLISSAGTLFGVMLGGLFLYRCGGLSKSSDPQQAFLRYLVGIIVLVALYMGMRMLHFGIPWAVAIYRFIRYGILGFWVSYGAPWIFGKLQLAKQPD
jgi:membrane-associated phospholipid phosphatase